MIVRLSGGSQRVRFVLFGNTMSKATVAKILGGYGVQVVQNCKDCDFIVVPANVRDSSKSAKKAAGNAKTITITKLMKLLLAQKKKTKIVKSAKAPKRVAPTRRYDTRSKK
jgi:hypothetical protein